ncbi:MAG: hypothetical protein CMJ89_03025 [Planctomycetes bacterium]|nr:hypothetical protein [Planctomycetota bacterium]
MYREIIDYSGNFGDPIDGIAYPFDRLTERALSVFELTGVCVAALCFLMNAIDNASHEYAVEYYKNQVASALRMELPGVPSVIRDAFAAFYQSEEALQRKLNQVYIEVILPQVREL